MKETALFDSSFNISKTNTYHLSIQFDLYSYSYVIIDAIRKQVVALKYVPYNEPVAKDQYGKKINEVIANDAFLNKNYKSIDFIYPSFKSMFVPNKFFDRTALRSFFTFNHKLSEEEEIHFNKIPATDVVNVFSISSYITTIIVNKFPEVRFFHFSSSNLESFINTTKESKIPILYFNVLNDFIEVTILNQGKLVFSNKFFWKHNNDILYFILKSLEVNDLTPKTPVFGVGLIEEDSELHLLLEKYFPNFEFGKTDGDYIYNFDVPEHLLFNILHKNENY